MNNSLYICTRKKLYSLIPGYYIRFFLIAFINFTFSYTCYLLLLRWKEPRIAYLLAYIIGIITGNLLHICLTHRRRLTAKNFAIQSTIQISVGCVATLSNAWVSQFIDPIISGFFVIIIFAGLSFNISRLLLR